MSELYVLQVMSNAEGRVIRQLKRLGISAFCLKQIKLERKDGKWHEREKYLMPGYVFVETDLTAQAYHNIKSVDGMIRFLGENKPESISGSEKEYIKWLANDGRPLPVCSVVRHGSGELILSGLLKKLSDDIINFDIRAKRAKVRLPMLENKEIYLSFEII